MQKKTDEPRGRKKNLCLGAQPLIPSTSTADVWTEILLPYNRYQNLGHMDIRKMYQWNNQIIIKIQKVNVFSYF